MYGVRLCGKNNGNFNKKHPGLNKGNKNPMHGKPCQSKKNQYQEGHYKSIYMRSSWEIAYAKYLDKSKLKWKYESKTFDLGDTTYTPDFYLPETNEYIEVKGYWRKDAKEKFKLFKKLYSKIKISVKSTKELKEIKVI